MSSSFKQPVQPNRSFREFNVGAPEDSSEQFPPLPEYQEVDTAQIEQEVKAARAARLANANKISDQAKKRIEILANIGRLTKDVTISNTVFTLRTLKNRELEDATLATFAISGTQLEASFALRKNQLARSLTKIDGNDIGAILGDNSIDAVISFLDNAMEEIVFNKLYDEFTALKKEVQTKYGINTNEEVKEVIADLKK